MCALFSARSAPEYGLGTEEKKPSRLHWLYLVFMVVLGLIALSLATQRIALYFGYHSALGPPLGTAFNLHWYAPWSVFRWQAEFGAESDPYGFIDHAITHSQALFLLPQFIIIGFWLAFMRKLKGKADLHGSAHWATYDEIE